MNLCGKFSKFRFSSVKSCLSISWVILFNEQLVKWGYSCSFDIRVNNTELEMLTHIAVNSHFPKSIFFPTLLMNFTMFKQRIIIFYSIPIHRGYCMVAWRYEISLRVLKHISRVSAASEWKIFSTREEKFRISKRPCTILFII